MKYAKRFTNNMSFIFYVISLVDAMAKQVFMPINAISPSHTDFSLFPATIHLKTYKLSKSLIIGLLLLLVGVGSVSGATKTWTGGIGTGKNWTTSTNWSPSNAPAAGDDVVFNTAGTITFSTLPGNISYNSLTISQGTITLAGTTITFTLGGNAGVDFTVVSGASLVATNVNIILAANATASIDGTYNNPRTFNTNGTTVVTTVTGTINNSGTVTCTTATKLFFQSGSTYTHTQDGGTIPTATWDAASTCWITGVIGTAPGGGNQTFGNFTWDCSGQNTWVSLAATTMSIQGNLTVNNSNPGTNAYDFSIEQDITIGKDLILNTNGYYRVCYQQNRILTVNGNVTINGGLLLMNSSGGTNANGTLYVAGNFNFSSGTINARAQTAASSASNIIFNGSGTMQTYTSGGTITSSANNNIINFTVNSGAYLQMGTGASPSTLTAQTTGGTNTFTVANGGTLGVTSTAGITTTGATGNIQANGTRTYTTGANYIYNGTASQVTGNGLTQHTPANNLTFSGNGTKTINSNVTVNSILSMEGTAIVAATATLTYNTSATLQYKGSGVQTTGTEFPTSFTGSGGLIIDNINGVTIKAADAAKSIRFLNIKNGILNTSSKVLSVTTNTTLAITGGSATSFINGPVNWTLPTNLATGSTYNFPVGSGTTYLPFALVNPTTSGTAPTAQVQANLADVGAGATFNGTLTAISHTEYWSLITATGFTSSSVSIYRQTTITPTFDAVGGSSTTLAGVYTTLSGLTGTKGVSSSNSIGTNRFFVLAKGKPTITVTPLTALNDFSYAVGLGPSSQLKFFTVSGSSLTTNISILPTTSFEISTTSGAAFAPQSLITEYVYNGNVAIDTVFIRMKAGLAVGAVGPENIPCSSDFATTQTASCSGTVVNAAVITVTSALTNFNYNVGSGPSTAQSFTVGGTNMTTNLIITAPTDYEISTTQGGTYGSSIVTYTPAQLATPQPVWVRLKAGLPGGPYNENITLTSTNAVTKNVVCSGSVNTPIITLSTVTLAGFIYTTGQGPSDEQTFIVSGKYLTDSIKITPPANFEISTTSGAGFVSAPIIKLNQSGGTVAATTIYVRMKAGLPLGTVVGSINLTSTSTWYLNQNVALSGIVANSATTISSKGILNGFVYTLGNGPSVEQSFTVSGTSLTSNITVTTPSSNIEASLTSGSGFTTVLTIKQSGGKVNAIPVYVRLKAGLSAASYPSETIVLSATSASSVNVVCNGVVVIPVPTITAGPLGLESTCNGASIGLTSTGTGLTNIYWNGPNGFYSTDPNPSLGFVSAANNGTYTVTANALSGVNLLTNGDFELGNTGFGSSYTFYSTTSTLEGIYFVVANPQSMHGGFCTCPDHTTGTGKQMVINGATSAGIIAWSESVSVVPGADYQFSYWVQTVSVAGYPAQLQLYVNGVPTGLVNTATDTESGWQKFICNTNSGSSNVLQLNLINKNIIAGGNDFALDDMQFQQAFSVSSSVALTVNPILAPSLSVTASNNPVYSGSTVTFTAKPTNGGSTPTYQWSVAGSPVIGATSSTYSYAPTNGQVVSCVMTSSYPCASPATASGQVTMTVNPRFNYWIGTISTNWSVSANWTAGFTPGPGDDVEYATAANNDGNPAINDLILDQDRTIGSLINSTARRLVIPAARSLIVNNNITTDGNPDRIYIYSSSSAANGTLIFHNPSNLPVQATVEMYSKAWFDLSAAVNYKYHWQYFGIPIRSVVSNPTFSGSYVRSWDETGTTISNHWVQLNNTSTLTSFLGYEISQQAAKTIVFQGQLENGDFNSGQLTVTSTALYPGQHIFANPYTAAIDIRQLTFGTQTEATVYLYNTGTYNDWNTSGGQSTPGNMPGQYTVVPKNTAGSTGIPRQIPSMQGFLIKAMSNSSLATFDISYNSVLMNNTDQQRASAINNTSFSDKVCTMIDVKGSRYADRMWIFSEPTCTRGFDNGWDGVKLFGSPLSPQLFAMEVDGDYQVDAVADMNNTELGFQAGEDVEYTLTFTQENLLTRYAGVYLVDSVENKTVDITESGSTYKFVAESAPTKVNRFKIITRPYEKDAPDADTQVKLFSSKGTIFVQNMSNSNGELRLYDMAGHYVKKVIFGANEVTVVSTNIKPGAYVAKALTNGEEVTKRLLVW